MCMNCKVEDQASAAVLAVSRKKVAKKKFVEYGCVSCLEVWSEDGRLRQGVLLRGKVVVREHISD